MAGEIIITFEKSGESIIQTKGIKGKTCTDVTKALESALGRTTSDKKTQEYYETAGVHAGITR